MDKYKEENTEQWSDEMKSVLELFDQVKKQKDIDVERNWHLLERRIRKAEEKHRLYTWIRNVAAILFVFVIFILSGYLYNESTDRETLSSVQLETVSADGSRTRICLSDGSEVWLNSGSTLSYPEHFTKAHREVSLSGEAYFKVKSDSAHRFDVKTHDGICVSAYGTEFNVKAYTDDSQVKATLAQGVIEMEHKELNLSEKLNPGEQAVFERDAREMYSQKVNLMTEISWKDGKIVFRRAEMEEVVRWLSRKFNVEVVLEGKEILMYTYSATFVDESLEEILELLSQTAPISYEIVKPSQEGNADSTRTKVILRLNK